MLLEKANNPKGKFSLVEANKLSNLEKPIPL